MGREMKDSGIEWIGEIPKEWKLARMKTCILQRDSGAWGNEANGEEGDIICLRIADFNYSIFRFKDTEEELLTKRNYNVAIIENLLLQKNDIVIEKSGGGEKTPVGRTVIFDKSYKAVYANFCDRLRCREIALPQFMQYIFVTFYTNGYIWNYIKQTTGIQNLDLTAMLSAEKIALPSIGEQQKIIDFLNMCCAELDNMLEKTRVSIEEYKKLKQAVITQAVTKGIRGDREMKDSGIEWIGEIPSAWDQCKLKNVSVRIGDGLHGTPEFDDNGNVYFINGNNIREKYLEIRGDTKRLSTDELMKYSAPIINDNTIMIALNGATYGKVSLYKKYPVLLGKSAGYITLVETVCREYIRYYLMSSTSKLMMALSLNGTTIQNLSLMTLNNFPTLLPPIVEQWEIVRYLDNKVDQIDALIVKKEQYLLELQSFKKSLIYEFVTGKKEVPQGY